MSITPSPSVMNASELAHQLALIKGPNWSPIPAFFMVVCMLALASNGAVMVAFMTQRSLRTPFNVYLMNLVTANFLHAAIENPAEIVNELYSGWWLGDGYCTLFIYSKYLIKPWVCSSHALITTNRIWAILWPHSYRQTHSRRVAFLVCFGGFLYVHIIDLPGFILDLLYYRLPLVTHVCFLNYNAQPEWSLAAQLLCYDIFLFVVLFAYPIIWWKRHQRNKAMAPKRIQVSVITKKVGPVPATTRSVTRTTTDEGRSATRTDGETATVVEEDSGGDDPEEGPRDRSKLKAGGARPKSKAFLILTMLTLSLLVCWTPMMTFYTITNWVVVHGDEFLEVSLALFAIQSLVDPLLFIVTMPDLRTTFRRWLGMRQP
ncbi:hypothetical protein BV898_01681 [Hypsibius exemplaris]|uniref:G-protein coupled receptors family 1 profile domain-containing protein n=1 Tax=Hypsibius exemplaris TaxID=2072580 RepID=A0A1W0XBD6_HYPEX|nr:hypothetical protein BV898_01681 [Hypsibius exemplaris]